MANLKESATQVAPPPVASQPVKVRKAPVRVPVDPSIRRISAIMRTMHGASQDEARAVVQFLMGRYNLNGQ